MIKVANEVQVYEVNGNDVGPLAGQVIAIKSHSIFHDRVVIEIEGKRLTVVAKDVQAALANATNVARY